MSLIDEITDTQVEQAFNKAQAIRELALELHGVRIPEDLVVERTMEIAGRCMDGHTYQEPAPPDITTIEED